MSILKNKRQIEDYEDLFADQYGEDDARLYQPGERNYFYGEQPYGRVSGTEKYDGPDSYYGGQPDTPSPYIDDQPDEPDRYYGGQPFEYATDAAQQYGRTSPGGRSGKAGFISSLLMKINFAIVVLMALYLTVVFTNLPLIGTARDLWIETAMTTAEHHWLATKFFPMWLIDKVMSGQIVTEEGTVSNPDLLVHHSDENEDDDALESETNDNQQVKLPAGEQVTDQVPPNRIDYGSFGRGFWDSLVGQYAEYNGEDAQTVKTVKVGDKDELGNTIILYDEDEQLYAVEVRTSGYVGRIMFISDPSRVVVRHTSRKNVQGDLIKTYLTAHDAIAGMNGNGFQDPEGHGKGGSIIGWSVSGGVAWGSGAKSEYASVGLNDQNVLVVGAIKDFQKHNIRDLAQYGPSVIVDGKKMIKGSGGWGLQPRSAIGQCEDGTILMATFDGRQPGHSLGITAGEVADILSAYGCINAGLCDGGSSSVMMYDGKVLGKPSTPMKDTGRYLPNAFLVLKISGEKAGDGEDDIQQAAQSAVSF